MSNDEYVDSREVSNHVLSTIHALKPREGQLTPAARANLAKLRRGLGKPAGTDLAATGIALGGLRVPSNAGDMLSHAEVAVYMALTAFGAHQQSKGEVMHKAGVRFGSAVRALAGNVALEGTSAAAYETSAWKALARMAGTSNERMVSMHLLSLVRRLRAANIGFDYGLLARDLFQMQFTQTAKKVRLRWTRDFNRNSRPVGAESKLSQNNSDTQEN